ncbi:bacterioferritin [Candidatus Scalindua japonica]|uniref:Bacterioferritin n=1 Tax=Candidatus Scalindua japonica TaxID=1284222 RepID=A0A286TU16_9BACT|nr:ferritin-like domain-containing protein [Candidatus Scalindua japonica]GAX59382.1 bacterioferritin [Candidatus Scalindua japonica]
MYEKSIKPLNQALAEELSGVHQYMYFHFHCSDQGFDLLANLFRKIAIEEMMHIERLAERILFLKGDVEMQPSTSTEKIHIVKDMLTGAKSMEENSAILYNKLAMECGSNADSVSRKLFEELVIDEENHYGQFDTELQNINKFGEQYLALQSIERSKVLSKQAGVNPATPP